MIETVCGVCGRQWTPSRREIVAGDWKTCPACRGQPVKAITNTNTSATNHNDNERKSA